MQEKTRRALFWMNVSHEPFVILYVLLPFILRKDLGASILQISILSALRPILPVFSFYWSANLSKKRHKLRANLIGAWVFARLPFILVFWVNNVWYLIFCCAVYEFFNKSGIPALIEILKINMSKDIRETTYTRYFVLSFLESIVLGIAIAWILDGNGSLWQALLGLSTLFGLTSVFFQLAVPLSIEPSPPLPKTSLSQKIIEPWQETFSLLKKDPEFAKFQYGFMMGGFSLMLAAPSLAVFYADNLALPISSVVTGRSILMGLGIVISSWAWKKMLTKNRACQLTQWILLGFALYLGLMLCAPLHLAGFYLAFFVYGIAQAGSHLLWNLSGILFAGSQDSSPFSRLNILMLGARGVIAPAIGGVLCKFLGPMPVFVLGIALCLAGWIYVQLAWRPSMARLKKG